MTCHVDDILISWSFSGVIILLYKYFYIYLHHSVLNKTPDDIGDI